MPARIDFGIITNLGNVANPVNAQDAATKAYVDSAAGSSINQIVLTNLNTTISNSPGIGATSVTFSGDETLIFVAGLKFQIGQGSSNQILTVISSSVSLGTTTVNFTPALTSAKTSGTATYSVAQASITSLEAGTNVTFDNQAGNLTINATGGGGSLTDVNLVEPNWRTVTKSTTAGVETLTVTDNNQSIFNVFSGNAGAATPMVFNFVNNPTSNGAATIDFTQADSTMVLDGFTPGTVITLTAGESIQTALTTSALGVYWFDSAKWSLTFNGPGTQLTATYIGTLPNPVTTAPVSGNYNINFVPSTTGWNATAPTSANSTPVSAASAPSFKPLSSGQVIQAISGTPTSSLVVGYSATTGLTWVANGSGGGVNITSPNLTIAVGGSTSAPTLDIAQQGATTTQALVWNGTKFAPAAQSLKFDSFANISGNLVTLGSVASGTNIASFTGDVRSTFPNGLVFYFAGITTPYTVTATTFASSVTDVQFTPNVSTTIASGTNIQVATKTPFTEVAAGSNVTMSVNSNVLTINAPTQINTYSYDSAVNYSGLRVLNGSAFSFSGNVDTTNIGSVSVTFNATATDGDRPNITLSSITGATFVANQSFFIFAPDGSWNITYAYLNSAGTQLAANAGILNTSRGNTIPIGTVANCIITGVEVVNTDPRSIRFNTQSVGASQAVIGLQIPGESNFTTETIVAGNNTYWDTDTAGNPRINAQIPINVGKGWIVSVGAGFDTTGGTYAGWSANTQFPRFTIAGQVVLASGINSTSYLGNTNLQWSTSNYAANALQVAQIWQAWNNSFSDALPITFVAAEDDLGRFTLHTAPLGVGVNPTQSNAVVQGLFNVGLNPNAGPDYINSIEYDDASGTYEYQRAEGGTVFTNQTLQQTLNLGNTANTSGSNVGTIVLTNSSTNRTTTLGGSSVSTPVIQLNGATSGSISFSAPNTTTSYPLVWPAAQGNAATVLTNDGSGNLTWSAGGSGGGNFPTYAAEYTITGFADPAGSYATPIKSQIAFNNGTQTFTIQPASGYANYDVWVNGNLYTVSQTYSIQIPSSTSALYNFYFYINAGALAIDYNTTFYNFQTQVPIASVYWNSSTGTAVIFADERHGLMDWRTHEYLHRTRGAAYATGFTISGTTNGSGTLATDAQIGITDGTFYDEDIQWDLTGSAVPISMPILARSGNAWITYPATTFPYYYISATQTAAYNLNTAGSWSTASLNNNDYGVMWVIATNAIGNPFLSLLGQNRYVNVGDASLASWNDLDLTGLPIVEFRVLYKLIFQTKTTFSNAVRVNQIEFQDWRTNTAAQLPAPTFNAVDTAFRDTPNTVFATDTTADTAWTSVVQSKNALLGGAFPSTNRFNRLVAAAPLYLTVDVSNVATIGTSSVLSYKTSVLGATTANLPATYANGASGVGATLTSNTNGVFTVDGVSFTLNARVLVKNQSANVQNGIYTVTTLGTVSTPWVLTRATDMNEPVEFINSVVIISQGTINAGDSYIETSNVSVIGTDSVVWIQFAENGVPTLQSVVVTGNSTTNPIFLQSSTGPGVQLTTGAPGVDPGVFVQSNDASTNIGYRIQVNGLGSLLIDSTTASLGGLRVTPTSSALSLVSTGTTGQSIVLNTSSGSPNGTIRFIGGSSSQAVTFTLPTATSAAFLKVDPGIANNTFWNANQFAIGQYSSGTSIDTGKLALVIDTSATTNIGLTVATPQTTNVSLTLTAGPASSSIIFRNSNSSNTNFLTFTPSGSNSNLTLAATDGGITYSVSSGNNLSITSSAATPNTLRIFPQASGSNPTITVASSDTNRGLTIVTAGTGEFSVSPAGTNSANFTASFDTNGTLLKAAGGTTSNAYLGLAPSGTGTVRVFNPALTTSMILLPPAVSGGGSFAKIDVGSSNALALNSSSITVGPQTTGIQPDTGTASIRLEGSSAGTTVALSVVTAVTSAVDILFRAGFANSGIVFSSANATNTNTLKFVPSAAGSNLTLTAATGGITYATSSGSTYHEFGGGANVIRLQSRATSVNPTISVSGDTNLGLEFNTSGIGAFIFRKSGGANTVTLTPSDTGQIPGLVMSGSDAVINFLIQVKGTGSALTVGAGSGFSQLSLSPAANSFLLKTTTGSGGPLLCDLQFQPSGSGAVTTIFNPAGDQSFSMTPPNTVSIYNLFNFNANEFRAHTSATAGFTFGNLNSTTGAISTTALNVRSTASQMIVQSFGGILANSYDLVLRAQQSGSIILGTATNSITVGTSAFTTPVLIADSLSPTSLSAGTSGQVLTSRGAGNTPYWSTPSSASLSASIYSMTANTAFANGSGNVNNSNFTVQVNGINISLGTSNNVWTIPANSGRLKVTLVINATQPVGYTSYWGFTTSSGIVTAIGFGSGTVASLIQYNSSGFTSSSTGGTPSSTNILKAYGGSDSFTSTSIGYINNSASARNMFFTYYHQAGTNNSVTLTTQTMIIIEQVGY